jgi:ribosomal protein L11 methyltransferase
MEYICVSFKVTPPEPGSEILVSVLAEENFESFVHNETGFEAFIQQPLYNEAVLQNLIAQFPEIKFTHTTQNIKQQNWNEIWEKSFNPVIIENYCSIRAPFHPAATPPLLDVVIEPKMSFGTGHHQTTWLMTKALFENDIKGKSVLDVGCGTGILAIIAKKLGANTVVGFDIDEWSIENSRENRKVNGFGKTDIDFFQGTIQKIDNQPFDLVLANINKNILLKELSNYSAVLNKGGQLFLSGFFELDAKDLIIAAEKTGLHFKKQETKNEWATLSFVK